MHPVVGLDHAALCQRRQAVEHRVTAGLAAAPHQQHLRMAQSRQAHHQRIISLHHHDHAADPGLGQKDGHRAFQHRASAAQLQILLGHLGAETAAASGGRDQHEVPRHRRGLLCLDLFAHGALVHHADPRTIASVVKIAGCPLIFFLFRACHARLAFFQAWPLTPCLRPRRQVRHLDRFHPSSSRRLRLFGCLAAGSAPCAGKRHRGIGCTRRPHRKTSRHGKDPRHCMRAAGRLQPSCRRNRLVCARTGHRPAARLGNPALRQPVAPPGSGLRAPFRPVSPAGSQAGRAAGSCQHGRAQAGTSLVARLAHLPVLAGHEAGRSCPEGPAHAGRLRACRTGAAPR